MNISLGKAGRKRWMGRKPHNRGTSMNPVSHPMGGGEGRTAGGRHPCSPTGVLAKGGKTRKKRKPSNAAIIRRRRPGPHYAREIIGSPPGTVWTNDVCIITASRLEWIAMSRSLKKGPYVDERLLAKVGAQPAHQQPRADQDVVARLHHRAGVRRRDVPDPQRPAVHQAVRDRGHGRPQARRVRPDADRSRATAAARARRQK